MKPDNTAPPRSIIVRFVTSLDKWLFLTRDKSSFIFGKTHLLRPRLLSGGSEEKSAGTWSYKAAEGEGDYRKWLNVTLNCLKKKLNWRRSWLLQTQLYVSMWQRKLLGKPSQRWSRLCRLLGSWASWCRWVRERRWNRSFRGWHGITVKNMKPDNTAGSIIVRGRGAASLRDTDLRSFLQDWEKKFYDNAPGWEKMEQGETSPGNWWTHFFSQLGFWKSKVFIWFI